MRKPSWWKRARVASTTIPPTCCCTLKISEFRLNPRSWTIEEGRTDHGITQTVRSRKKKHQESRRCRQEEAHHRTFAEENAHCSGETRRQSGEAKTRLIIRHLAARNCAPAQYTSCRDQNFAFWSFALKTLSISMQ